MRRFSLSPSSWVSLFSFCCNQGFRASPVQILSNPLRFPGAGRLPGFYLALLTAWRSADGAFLPNRGSLCVGSGLTVMPVTSLWTKSAYLMLLSVRSAVPLCVVKFFLSPLVPCIGLPPGVSYFSSTWTVRSLTCLGKWHMVCCIRLTVCHPLAMPFPRPASVAIRWSLWTICFSLVLWLIVSFPGCLLCFFFLRHPLVLFFSVMFGLVSRRMSFCVSLASLSTLLMSANSPSGWP